ncbi:MAG: YraN family protein [Gammaproteobacteria bacterium]|nr:YraN family protein [Gammaproteobacteria bacterium]
MRSLFRQASRTTDVGKAAEDAACRFLESRGCALIEHNYRCRMGEIDLVMRQDETLVFVEVRYRRYANYGSGAESVDARKQGRLIRTAQHYLSVRRIYGNCPVRFDVVSVCPAQRGGFGIDWIPGAFETR